MAPLRIYVLFTFILGTCITDACYNPEYSRYPNHTMCRYPLSCTGKDLLAYGLIEQEKLVVLHVLNKFRSLVATGSLPWYFPAKNMRQLVWDKELADMAERWAEQCVAQEDTSLVNGRFQVGQILGHSSRSPISEEMDQDTYLLEYIYLVFQNAFDGTYPAKYVSAYRKIVEKDQLVQILWAESQYLGCGHSIYVVEEGGVHAQKRNLACNFGPKGRIKGKKLYDVGLPACEVESEYYKGLCSTREVNENFKNPCEDEEFNSTYPHLCVEEKFYHWIGHGVPFKYISCNAGVWKDSFWVMFSTMMPGLLIITLGSIAGVFFLERIKKYLI